MFLRFPVSYESGVTHGAGFYIRVVITHFCAAALPHRERYLITESSSYSFKEGDNIVTPPQKAYWLCLNCP